MNTCVKKSIFLAIGLLYSLISLAQIKEDTALIKPQLIENDSLFVKRLAHVYKNTPANILPLFNAVTHHAVAVLLLLGMVNLNHQFYQHER